MEINMDIINLFVPSIISIAGFAVTFSQMKKEFKNALKEKLTDEQREVYFEALKEINKLLADTTLVYDGAYYDTLTSYQARIDLMASSSVRGKFREIVDEITGYRKAIESWKGKNDPTCDLKRFHEATTDTGEVYEVSDIQDWELDAYEIDYNKYVTSNAPSVDQIKKIVDNLLLAMRKDLGHDN